MRFLKSHRGAMVVAVLVIALSAVFGAHRSLTAVRGDIAKSFSAGADNSGHSVSQDIVQRL